MQGTWLSRRRKVILKELIPILIIFLLVIIDQTIKFLVSSLNDANKLPIVVIDNFFEIIYTRNYGAAFSFLSNKDWAQIFFMVLTPIALILFCFLYVIFRKRSAFIKYAFALIIAGTIGNFVDRIYYGITTGKGFVVDFLSFDFGSLGKFATFNIADSFLTVGVLMVLVYFLFLDNDAIFKFKKEPKNNKNNIDDSENKEQ